MQSCKAGLHILSSQCVHCNLHAQSTADYVAQLWTGSYKWISAQLVRGANWKYLLLHFPFLHKTIDSHGSILLIQLEKVTSRKTTDLSVCSPISINITHIKLRRVFCLNFTGSKIDVVILEPLMRFGCPSRFRISVFFSLVFFMTESTFLNHQGVAAPYRYFQLNQLINK